MMKNNLLALQSVIRSVHKFSSLGVKIIVQPSRPNCSSYQKLDKPNHRQAADKLVLPKILRKCFRQFSNSSKRLFTSSIDSIQSCWNCTEKLPANEELHVFCRNCGLIREIEDGEQDYFYLFGLPQKFTIDTVELTTKFRKLQSVIHPDKFSNKSNKEQQLSSDWSSLINMAYKTLLAPIKRGEYLLKLHGIEVPEGNTTVGSLFLLEMMERNEEVDDAQSFEELQKLLQKVRDDLQRVIVKLDASLQVKGMDTALQHVITLRYLISLETSIKTKNTRLGFGPLT